MASMRLLVRALAAVSTVIGLAECYAPTDYITWGGDNSRNGYRSNHNLDPAIVASPQFQQIFATSLPGNYGNQKEQFYSMPLVFTPGNDPNGRQFLYVSTTQNNVYKLDAATGEIVASRNLAIPFLSLDLRGQAETCADIDPHIGIIGTGVIDPVTETLYVIVKTYADQSKINEVQGRPAGRHNIHALSLNDLSERPNFPVNFEGLGARNNPTRLFQAGIHNQRPGLLQQGQNIYAGFGSHCVNYNITGWVIGFDKTSGSIVEHFATQGEGVLSPTKGASIWMSGGGIAADDRGSIFFSTGNGYASQLSTIPVEGRTPPTALEEAVVHMTIQEDGKVKPVDFFMPEEKQELDGNDQDLGTSPFVLLPSQFSCGSVSRIGVVTGKSGWTYWLNMDDLGGYRTNGAGKPAGQRDRIIYKYKQLNSVYSGAGVYPLEGGYVHINPIGFPTTVFKFSCANSVPSFTYVGESVEANTGRLGPSHGAVTSLNGQPGTGLLWTTDVDNPGPSKWHFKIHEPIPGPDGKMKLIKGFHVTGIRKFNRPIFGNGRVYIPAGAGIVYGFGAPTKPALDCTVPTDFGAIELGAEAAEKVITCTAKIPVTVANITVSSTDFTVTDTPSIPRTLATGASFTFKAHFKPTSVGNLTSTVRITTQNTDATNTFSVTTSVQLSGQGQSSAALFSVQPKTLAFNPVGRGAESVSQDILIANQGKAALSIESIQYSDASPTGPFIPANTTQDGSVQFGQFTLADLPTSIAPETSKLVKVTFSPSELGNFVLYVSFTTNGGTEIVKITASTGSPALAVIEWEKPDGSGWVTWTPDSSLGFGNILQNTERRLKLRLTNGGGPGSVALEVPISKPPFGTGGLIGAANQADLAEGTRIEAGQSAEATMICHAPKTNWNVDSKTERAAWTFNFNDPTMGKVNVPFDCTAVSQQGGPLTADGDGVYRYVGCFRENTPGRQLKQQILASDNMTADMCLKACAEKGFAYCGEQYHRECWGGPTPPNTPVGEENCNFDCTGAIDQWCGGNGEGAGSGNPHITLFATDTKLPENPSGPFTNPGVNGYTSIGCYTEATTGRALPNGLTPEVPTVAGCISACSAKGYKLCGMQYSQECFGGNEMASSAVIAPITDCNLPCKGNSSEFCGGSSRNNVYQRNDALPGKTVLPTTTAAAGTTTAGTDTVPATTTAVATTTTTATVPASPTPKSRVGAFVYQGCYTESTSDGRSLNGKSYFNDLMTVELCTEECAGFKYSATEYGRECYCGNELRGTTALDNTPNACNFPCPGDKSTLCGAGNRLSLYKFDDSAGTAGSTAASSTTAESVAPTSSPATSAASTSTLTSAASSSIAPTTAASTTAVSTSAAQTTTSTLAATTTQPISTTTTLVSTSTVPPPQGTVTPPLWPGNVNFTYYGCVREPSSGRLFPRQILNVPDMTQEKCLEAAWMYQFAGIEYKQECWGFDTINWAGNVGATPGYNTTDASCDLSCAGDTSLPAANRTKCGGRSLMTLFYRDPAKQK